MITLANAQRHGRVALVLDPARIPARLGALDAGGDGALSALRHPFDDRVRVDRMPVTPHVQTHHSIVQSV